MREIKFRAWYTPFRGKKIGVGYKYGNSVISFHEMSPEKYEIEQYTGLKDFNGAEIYEGDILQDVDDSTIVGVVEYDEAFGEYDCGDNNLYECTSDWEVIGNIHENVDLLNDTDRISPDDIGNDIHEFLHGEDK